MLSRLAECGSSARPLHVLAFLLISLLASVARGQEGCSWIKQRDTTVDTANATERRVVASLSECRTFCSTDSGCRSFLYKVPSCYKFRVLPAGERKKKGWSYYTKECTEVPTPAPLPPPPRLSEKASCTWTELRDTAADENSADDTYYVMSLVECWAVCDRSRRCAVTTFQSPVCRIYGQNVSPVERAGWTYLRKSCQSAGAAGDFSVDEPVTETIASSTPAATTTSAAVGDATGDVPLTSSCSWDERPDTSAGKSGAADTRYFLSRVDCTEYCNAYPGCIVVVYKPMECLIYDDDVTPVADEGWTLLRKSCMDGVERPTFGQETEPVTEASGPEVETTSGPGKDTAGPPGVGTTSESETETSDEDSSRPTTLGSPGARSCIWGEVLDRSTKQVREVNTEPASSLEDCKAACEKDSRCQAVVFNSPSCRKVYDITPIDDAGSTYLKKICDTTEATLSESADTTPTTQNKNCSWTELPDTSAEESSVVDRYYVFSKEECSRVCANLTDCVVAEFKLPFCRIHDNEIAPVNNSGWTYLKKSCTPTGLSTATDTDTPLDPDTSDRGNSTEETTEAAPPAVPDLPEPSPVNATAAPAPCTWLELPDSSADESSAVESNYFFSQDECTDFCANRTACVVAVFNLPFCRTYDEVVIPVDDAGWTYLKKICPSTATDTDTPLDPDTSDRGNSTEVQVTEEYSTEYLSSPASEAGDIAAAVSCTWSGLPGMSAEDSVLVETVYASSLGACQDNCQGDSTCTVVIYSNTVCRKFHDVTPVADPGWTFMRKTCTPAETQAQPPES